MKNQINQFLLQSNLIALVASNATQKASTQEIGTVVSNLMYFGFTPNVKALSALNNLSSDELNNWWENMLPALEKETGTNVKMDNFVVYKNFPSEVLEMSQAVYWLKQSLIYSGVDADLLNEDEDVRPEMKDDIKLKVLSVTFNESESLKVIFNDLKAQKTRWNDKQAMKAMRLSTMFKDNVVSTEFAFKENFLIVALISPLNNVFISDATDVLRFAVALSTQVKSETQTVEILPLEKGVKFGKFTRSQRRALLNMMENSKNLEEDAASRKSLFKKFFSFMHPGDFKFIRVQKVYDSLYNNKLQSFSGKVEGLLLSKDNTVIDELKTRPGDYLRRFSSLYQKLDKDVVVNGLVEILPKLSNLQLLKLEKLITVKRETLIYPPRGNWSKAQFVENTATMIEDTHQLVIVSMIANIMEERLSKKFPDGITLDKKLNNVRLATNDQKLANYGRGTRFEIPSSVNVIRTASYWATSEAGNIWYDNGFNFFDSNWNSKGTVCWNSTNCDGAVFSGDPTNSTELEGRACQMIDLDLNKLKAQGVKYAVWNILCYSQQSFSKAKEVLATMQFCEDELVGKLFEPARAQMVFPLVGDNMTKYIAMIDVESRELVYWDANLAGEVSSASNNAKNGDKFKAFTQYLDTLPTVYDLFKYAKNGVTPVVFSDENIAISGEAYVFKPLNSDNAFKQIELNTLLN